MLPSLDAYPHWFVVTCAVLAGAAGLWLAVKLIKAAVWLACLAFVLALVLAAASYLLHQGRMPLP